MKFLVLLLLLGACSHTIYTSYGTITCIGINVIKKETMLEDETAQLICNQEQLRRNND